MDEVTALNALGLPWWVTLGRPVVVVAVGVALAAATFWAIGWFGGRALARTQSKVWRVRAALASDVRGAFTRFAALGSLAVGGAAILGAPLSAGGKAAIGLSAYVCIRVLQISIQDDWERRILARPRAEDAPRASFVTLAALVACVAYVAATPARYDLRGTLWAVLGCAALLMLTSPLGAKAVCRLYLRQARPTAVDVVTRAARVSALEAPRVFEISSPYANAFALSGARSVGFTDTALELLRPEELELIARHELGHLREGFGAGLARTVFGLRPWLLIAFLPAVSPPSTAVIYGGGCWFIVGVAQRWLASTLELRADRHVTAHGDDGAAYARVLERVQQLNLMLGEPSSTDPGLNERLRGVGVAVAAERTGVRRKAGAYILGSSTMAVVLFLLLSTSSLAVREQVGFPARHDSAGIHRALALRGDDLGLLIAGSLWAESGDLARARRALAATEMADVQPEATLLAVGLHARGAACAAARVELASLMYCDTEAECESRLRSTCAKQGSSVCVELARRELRAMVEHCGEPQLFKLGAAVSAAN